jgi:hypothetical protein
MARRFGAQEFLPMVVGLIALRGWSVWGAALLPPITLVVLLHRVGARGAHVVDGRGAAMVVVAALAVYACMVVTIAAGAYSMWSALGLGTTGAFVRGLTEAARPGDLAVGVVASTVYGALAGVGARTTAQMWLSQRWGLVPKLLAVGGAFGALLLTEGTLLRIVDW